MKALRFIHGISTARPSDRLYHIRQSPLPTFIPLPVPLFCMRRNLYLSFFFGRSWFVWPHLRFRQLVALGGRRAY